MSDAQAPEPQHPPVPPQVPQMPQQPWPGPAPSPQQQWQWPQDQQQPAPQWPQDQQQPAPPQWPQAPATAGEGWNAQVHAPAPPAPAPVPQAPVADPQWAAVAAQHPEATVGADGTPMIDLTAAPQARPAPGDVVLTVDDLEVYYGAAVALKGISFEVREGEVVVIIGANGAGKTTTMRTISGVSEPLQSTRGHIAFRGRDISKLPAHKVQRLGVSHVPEGRHIFGESSVEDNLLLGAIRLTGADRGGIAADVERIYERFPVLGDRRNRPAGLLSGGEQQMLAISRALMGKPEVILLDEPSLGLAPILQEQLFTTLRTLADLGLGILVVEQLAHLALEIADRGYVLDRGDLVAWGTPDELRASGRLVEAYLGRGANT